MTDFIKSYVESLKKMGPKKARKEHADWQEARAEAERRDRDSQRKLAEYLRLKGESE